MKSSKTFNGAIHHHEGIIYAMGGNERDTCERFDIYNNRWEVLQSYGELCQGTSELNGWCQIQISGRPNSGHGAAMM